MKPHYKNVFQQISSGLAPPMSAVWLETASLLSSYSGKMQCVALQSKVKCSEEQQENRNTLWKSLGLRIGWPCACKVCNGFVEVV